MTDPTTAGRAGDVERVLGEHERRQRRDHLGRWLLVCSCGNWSTDVEFDDRDEAQWIMHRAHLAQQIEALVTGWLGEALLPIRRYVEASAITAQATGQQDRAFLDLLILLDKAELRARESAGGDGERATTNG